jgi:hypothetical protein
LAAITAISAATANAKSMRLIKRYLLVRATLGGLLLITRGSYPCNVCTIAP